MQTEEEGAVLLDTPIIRPIPDYDGKRSFRERQRRRQKDLNRLSYEVHAVIQALPQYQLRDCDFESAAERLKSLLGTTEIIPIPVRGPQGVMVVILAPMRIWYDAKIRKRLWNFRKSSAINGDKPVRLLSQRWIRRRPFLDNCKLVARCANMSVAARDRFSVLTLVREDPLATLEDCAAVVRAPDPVGVVFALIAGGLLTINFETAITPMSSISERQVER
ncbi:hypothetical protein [Chenggangzhangella methanolivorans]|uniref:Uncharacterized protein n=1 Tax=Chenggangzhangella methanolivorans TaxID=1437009 RepID=A0A9E6RC26_9HYPH|nr:hypothetical protein [Chenggangzhangella methanolivorans]QZO02063.1 hypothetical protein K6K41_12785 [Chenggangzhangella methanolivorans]